MKTGSSFFSIKAACILGNRIPANINSLFLLIHYDSCTAFSACTVQARYNLDLIVLLRAHKNLATASEKRRGVDAGEVAEEIEKRGENVLNEGFRGEIESAL